MKQKPNPTRAISPLQGHLGYWMRLVSNQVSHAFQLKIESQGVTVAEWVLLRSLLDTAEINPSRLATEIGLTRGAVSKLVDRLVAKGHVTRRAEKTDQRFQRIGLTDGGRLLVPMLADLADQNDAEFFRVLDDDERNEMFRMLKRVAEVLELNKVPLE